MTTSSTSPTSLEWRDATNDDLLMVSLLMPAAPFPPCPICAQGLASHSWVRVDLRSPIARIYSRPGSERLSLMITDCSNDARD